MRIAFVYLVFIWEVILLRLFRDAGFEGTLNRVTCEIEGAWVRSGGKKYLCLFDAQFREFLQLGPIHWLWH